MQRFQNDLNLRQALYGLYVSLFQARKKCPDDFKDGRITTIMTAIMGMENLGWRVTGITKEALQLLSEVDFDKSRLPRRLCRGHRVDRIQTARQLFDSKKPKLMNEFFGIFLENDRTVIMLNEQNRHSQQFPSYIEIENPEGTLFPNGSLVGWKHRKKEREFLRALHLSLTPN
jgi:hypothetical protein